jgi:hypothetical protein
MPLAPADGRSPLFFYNLIIVTYMSVYHFMWQGKERSVSINIDQKHTVLLDFIDDEIVAKVGGRIMLKAAGKQTLYIWNRNEIISVMVAEDLLDSIQLSTGKRITSFPLAPLYLISSFSADK